MNVPVVRGDFELRVRSWVDEDAERNLARLEKYLSAHWPDDNASFEGCDLDFLNECLWTLAQSRSRLWAAEGLDEMLKEIREFGP